MWQGVVQGWAGHIRGCALLFMGLLGGCGYIGYEAIPSIGTGGDPAVVSGSRDADAVRVAGWADPGLGLRVGAVVPAGAVEGALADFPVLIRITGQSALWQARPDGSDLRFFDADTGEQLDHDIESIDVDAGDLIAWVRVPSLQPREAFGLHLYWGGAPQSPATEATQVWRNGFRAVWHLQSPPGAAPRSVLDAGPLGAHAQAGAGDPAASPQHLPGAVGTAAEFDGLDDYVLLPTGSSRPVGCVSHWLRPASPQYMVAFYEADGALNNRAYDGFSQVDPALEMHTSTGTPTAVTPDAVAFIQDGPNDERASTNGLDADDLALELAQWSHIAYCWDYAESAEIFVNGFSAGRTPLADKALQLRTSIFRTLGRPANSRADRFWQGGMDEVRLSEVVRSAAWVAASVANQRADATWPVALELQQRP